MIKTPLPLFEEEFDVSPKKGSVTLKKLSDYQIQFTVRDANMKLQNEIYDLLVKNLSFEAKTKLKIEVIDPIGGRHDIFNRTGIRPDGFECRRCDRTNCNSCTRNGATL